MTVTPTIQWGDGVIREARRQLFLALANVGKEPTVLTMRKIALHMRRSLSDAEIATLSCEWLAIPAQDEFSDDGEIEIKL